MSRVLVVSAEPVSARIAGPAIRAYELARALVRAGHAVTLSAPAPSGPAGAGLALVEAGFEDYDALLEAAARHDVVVAQMLPPRLLTRVARLGIRLVVDLYNPTVVEVIAGTRQRPPDAAERQRRVAENAAAAHLIAADLVLCASDAQRDLWLGGLALRGLLDEDLLRRDPQLERFLVTVPFGVPVTPPQPGAGIRAAFPGIGADERILVWGGGIWDWLDAPTAIRATALLEGVHLVFPGVDRPALDARDAHRAPAEARGLAAELGLAGTRVHFGSGWVPYQERGAWLLDADLGVSAHPASLESRFAFRTRILDYLWAGLPVVATEGDALSALVAARGAGRAVPAGDPEAFAAACRELLDAPQAARAASAALAEELTWDRVAAPVAAFCASGAARPWTRARRRALAAATVAQYAPIARETLDRRGAGYLARKLAWNAGRVLRRR